MDVEIVDHDHKSDDTLLLMIINQIDGSLLDLFSAYMASFEGKWMGESRHQ